MTKKIIREQFIIACEELDVRILEPYLEVDQIICGLDKYWFLAFLHNLLEEAKKTNRGKLIMVEKYCRICHLDKSTLEFYYRKPEPLRYRITPYTKELIEYRDRPKPVFAFALIKDTYDSFDIEVCQNSWGYQDGVRAIDLTRLNERIYKD